MNTEILNLAADVLEKTAAYVDAMEAEKLALVATERSKIANVLKTRFEEATGESLSDDVVAKLAGSDTDIVNLIEKLAGASQPPESLGGPGKVREEAAAPRTHKEAVSAAEDRFAAWLTNS